MSKNLSIIKNTIMSDAVKSTIAARLGEKAGTFTTSILDLIGDNSQLQECDPMLIIKESMKAAGLDLPLNKNLGFAYIIPYKERGVMTPHFQMGHKGYLQLAIRTGQYKHLNAGIIYEGEEFIIDRIKGMFEIGGQKTSDKAIGFFAYMQLLNGFEKAICWGKKEVENHAKKFSKSYAAYIDNKTKVKPVWVTDFESMALKTMILRLIPKYGPMTIEITYALENDKADFSGFFSDAQEEIDENANKEVIDIKVPEEIPGPDGMTDSEKAEILKAETQAAALEEEEPPF